MSTRKGRTFLICAEVLNAGVVENENAWEMHLLLTRATLLSFCSYALHFPRIRSAFLLNRGVARSEGLKRRKKSQIYLRIQPFPHAIVLLVVDTTNQGTSREAYDAVVTHQSERDAHSFEFG